MPLRRRKGKTQNLVPVEKSRELLPFEEMEKWFEEGFRNPFSWMRGPFSPRWAATEKQSRKFRR